MTKTEHKIKRWAAAAKIKRRKENLYACVFQLTCNLQKVVWADFNNTKARSQMCYRSEQTSLFVVVLFFFGEGGLASGNEYIYCCLRHLYVYLNLCQASHQPLQKPGDWFAVDVLMNSCVFLQLCWLLLIGLGSYTVRGRAGMIVWNSSMLQPPGETHHW